MLVRVPCSKRLRDFKGRLKVTFVNPKLSRASASAEFDLPQILERLTFTQPMYDEQFLAAIIQRPRYYIIDTRARARCVVPN